MRVVLQMTVVVWTWVANENLGKLQSAGMLTHWRFWRFSDTIIWLLSWVIHGRLKSSWAGVRSTKPGRIFFYLVTEDNNPIWGIWRSVGLGVGGCPDSSLNADYIPFTLGFVKLYPQN
jgi:hypothetical protein